MGINQTREDLHSMRLIRTREVRIEGDKLLSMLLYNDRQPFDWVGSGKLWEIRRTSFRFHHTVQASYERLEKWAYR